MEYEDFNFSGLGTVRAVTLGADGIRRSKMGRRTFTISTDDFGDDIGFASTQGRRSEMEDTHILEDANIGGTYFRILAIFDGHGGRGVSEFLEKNFVKELFKGAIKKAAEDPEYDPFGDPEFENLVAEVFYHINDVYSEGDAGSTAVVCFMFADRCFVANVGDSRAILIGSEGFIPLTEDAKPDVPRFRKKITEQGGFVINGRVNGVIATAGYIGNKSLGLDLSKPDFSWIEIDKDDVILLACDGLFETEENWEIASMAKMLIDEGHDLNAVAATLIDMALRSGTGDNVSVVLCQVGDPSIHP